MSAEARAEWLDGVKSFRKRLLSRGLSPDELLDEYHRELDRGLTADQKAIWVTALAPVFMSRKTVKDVEAAFMGARG